MKAKKGSKAWKAKLSAAQKKGWIKRKAKVYVEEPIEFSSMPTEDFAKSPAGDDLAEVRSWIDAAPSAQERNRRKAVMMGVMYSGGGGLHKYKPEKMVFNYEVKPGNWQLTDGLVRSEAKESLATDGKPLFSEIHPAWRNKEDIEAGRTSAMEMVNNATNPKTLTGNEKVPVLSLVPPSSILAQATAMRYGAFYAPKTDGSYGYGPYNWRDQPIEAHIYIDAAMRHLMQWWDGDEAEIIIDDEGRAIDNVSHLAFALATIGILIDARANGTAIDDRPKVRKQVASTELSRHKLPRFKK